MKIAIVLLTLLASSYALAETIPSIAVKGEGQAEIAPDYIQISALVSGKGRDSKGAKQDADQRMEAVATAVGSFGIASEDVVFGGASLIESYKYDENENEIPTGYEVTRTLELKLRDFAAYERLIHALVSSGIDEIEAPTPGIDDKNKLKKSALQHAAANARSNAEAIGETLGIRIGGPLEIAEDGLFSADRFGQFYGDFIPNAQEVRMTQSNRGAPVPLMFVPENITSSAVVWIRFEVLPKKE